MKDFDVYFKNLDRGRPNEEAGTQLRRVVAAVQRTGVKGEPQKPARARH